MENQMDLSQFDMNLISYIIRKERNERGFTQEYLSDKTVSDSTISDIENQKGNVKPQKIFHVLAKLGIYKEDLPNCIEEIEAALAELNFRLEFIKNLIDMGELEEAITRLNQISIKDYHPLAPFFYFLKASYFYRKKKWKKAEQNFLYAIHLFNQYKIKPKDNIIAMCYNGLSRCKYNQNDLGQALNYVNQGLDSYNESLGRNDIKYPLIGNKIFYLLSSSQNAEAFQLMNHVWPIIPQADLFHAVLDLYKFRAILLRKNKNYSEAIQCCEEGIRISYRKQIHTRTIDLLLVLGSIRLKRKEFDKADEYFQMAICLDKNFDFPRRHMDAYIYLGILYFMQEDWPEADKYLNKAIQIGREIKDEFRLAKSLIVYGNCYLKQKQYEKAAPYYQEAADLAEDHGYKNHQITSYFKLAQCFGKLGKEEGFSEYIKKFFLLQHDTIESEDDEYEFF
ncbi:tetratricopeptide repeat protein [Thermoactinomyces mirandus]|uniref:Tetratricopeptide repeat protein n=1 Tax=Thermoactinomyces mirandus TaxID=2756294 RepID=A0A7W2ARR6_9BACL|nr:tetratricopeptide repeat protein [Thermoactinomyces mirandus]MBA4601865.1 tetratricopeptide repeat protein [Thermoactinomyces mirandus]